MGVKINRNHFNDKEQLWGARMRFIAWIFLSHSEPQGRFSLAEICVNTPTQAPSVH